MSNAAAKQTDPLPPSSYTKPITSIPTSRLTVPNDLDDLASPKSQIPRDRILLQDPRQLRLLEMVPLQQRDLLLLAERVVLGHQLVLGDVDQQVLLEKGLEGGVDAGPGAHGPARGRGERGLGHEDADLVVVLGAEVGEFLHGAGTDATGLGAELDPDGAALGGRVGVGRGGRRGVLLDHVGGGAGGELHLAAAGKNV